MERIITQTLEENCDIDKTSSTTLAKALTCKLRPYLKKRPSLVHIASNPLYRNLTNYGKIQDMCCSNFHAVIHFNSMTDIKGIMTLNGKMFSKEHEYPMFLDIKTFGTDMILLELFE